MAYWMATRLQAHCENKAEFFLQQFGYETYLPKVRWRTSRTRATRVSALFPGYIFVRVERLWRDIRLLAGVLPHPGLQRFEFVDLRRHGHDPLQQRESEASKPPTLSPFAGPRTHKAIAGFQPRW
jgi:hypothetical protein